MECMKRKEDLRERESLLHSHGGGETAMMNSGGLDEVIRAGKDVEVPDTAHLNVLCICPGILRNSDGPSQNWIGVAVGLLATAISLYANALVAKLHEYGGKRHIRYRDLAGFIYGRNAYSLTWGLQYVNLFMINVGFIILAGSALKAGYAVFQEDDPIKLPYATAFAGLACAIFAIAVPHLSDLRTPQYKIIILPDLPVEDKDGEKGTTTSRIFSTIGASANLVFAFNTGMLPEIQATIRRPVVQNMMKALYFQFTVGVVPMYAVTFIGYWAYGNSTSVYLMNSVNGPAWAKAFANFSALLQTIFASPMYEYLDTKFGIEGSALAAKNLSFRIMHRDLALVECLFLFGCASIVALFPP
ncbi:hypothetical protein Leryth_021089 [Lithospermum erythrorhizon]|nr:hypothetical protein Leryth_021089 [Lithospermum erythrorhizon]